MASSTLETNISETLAPASLSLSIALSKAFLGKSTTFSIATFLSIPSFNPFTALGAGRRISLPDITPNNLAASSTLFVNGPTVSNRLHKGTTPSRESLPAVVLKPTKSFQAAGIRTEPPVSEPIPAAARPNDTDVAAPDEDPPGTDSG